MRKLIVTGCNGQLGRAVNLELKDTTEYEVINTDVEDLDITDLEAVLKLFQEVKPYAVINCAAHTGVDACETQIDLAYRINAIGPRNLSIAAAKAGAKMIQVSTDYVFAGDASTPYTEFDEPGPKGMYGKTKLAGEEFVKQFAKEYFIIRTAWLYGDGKNFVKTMLRLAETNDTVKVVNDQVGSPTSAKELAKAILTLLPTDSYGIYHGTCEGVCDWAEFAREIFRLAGKNTKVIGISTEEYNAPGKRPAYSVLDNSMFRLCGGYQFAEWHDAIREYIQEM